jgi:thioredoxin 1
MSKIIDVTSKEELERVVKENGKVVVDFWAPWCGPCRRIAPTMEELSEDDNGITVVKVNTDESDHAWLSDNNIRSIPTLHFYVDGEFKVNHIGACSKEHILKSFE